MNLRVNEIFYSLQGEGRWTGTPACFVRLSGCNLRCPFCDTDHSAYTEMGIDEIMTEISRYPAPIVVITGGEPSLQPLDRLTEAIHKSGRRVHIETNGTRPVPETIDWVTCSPKDGGEVVLTRIDELKVVYQGRDVEELYRRFRSAGSFYLQPCSGENIPETIDYILQHPHWTLSLQTHKISGIR